MKIKTLLFLLLICSSAFAAKVPLGVYVVTPNDDSRLAAQPAWKDPHIIGVVIRTRWVSVQPTQGTTYNWTYLDHGLSLAHQYGKKLMMQINGSSNSTPGWLYTAGAKAFPLKNNGAGGPTTPWPNDSVLQSNWSALVQAWAARYDSDASLMMVTLWCGGRTIECFFADDPADLPAFAQFGGASAWLAGTEVLAQTGSNFVTTPVSLATGKVASGDGNVTMRSLTQYFRSLYPGKVDVQSNGESPTFPSTNIFPHTNLTTVSIKPVGYQLVQPVPAGQTLGPYLENALDWSATWIQIYPGDPSKDPGERAIINFNTTVGAH